jgi:signal transduction histidine kinase
MATALSWRSRNSRTALIVVLLLISLATATLLALQAHYLEDSQRTTAEGVLRDYSALIADEVIRRSTVEVGYAGYYPLVEGLRREIQQSGEFSEATTAAFPSSQDARLKRASGLAKGYFLIYRPADRLVFLGTDPGAEATAWLRKNIPLVSAQRSEGSVEVVNTQIAGVPRIFVATSVRGPRREERLAGFEVDLSVLGQWLGTALNRQPLVPPSLGHGRVTNASVHVSIRDQSGIERFRLGQEWSPRLAIVKPFGDTYQGILSGFKVESSLDPRVAGQIIIGGLPSSRLGLFLGLLALNAAIIVTAILQLRREMALQRLRDEFVSSVSHELRTPLTQIRMFAETLLLDRIRSEEERRRSLEIIDRESRRLTHLVENVLQFSRMERKTATLSKEVRELAPLIQEIVDDFESVVPSDQALFECRLTSGLQAKVDPDALRQIVINLLDNALKYGRKRQRVIVGLDPRDGRAVFFVDDEGPGIPAADRKRIFEQFQRLERDRNSATAGTGIGLSVVRELAGLHGGSCAVTTGDRGGAKFVVELPLSSDGGTAPDKPGQSSP